MTKIFRFAGHTIRRGESSDLRIPISEGYTGDPIHLPVRVIQGEEPGPKLFVSATIHGEELNGAGIVHELMYGETPNIRRGTLALLPVVNVFGFESQSRYMPDRRDLNRSFPGNANGSLTSRLAHTIFTELSHFDFGLDLHTAATFRTNYPNVRADFSVPACRKLAKSFCAELMVNGKGPDGSFRRECVRAGCAVVTVEAGEPFKIEPSVLSFGIAGINGVLEDLEMIDRPPAEAGSSKRSQPVRVRIEKSTWVRAEVGGILRFHVAPGDLVAIGDSIATNVSVFGGHLNVLQAPASGVVLGMATLPCAKPGEPIVHIGVLSDRQISQLAKARSAPAAAPIHTRHARVKLDLATNVSVDTAERETFPTGASEND